MNIFDNSRRIQIFTFVLLITCLSAQIDDCTLKPKYISSFRKEVKTVQPIKEYFLKYIQNKYNDTLNIFPLYNLSIYLTETNKIEFNLNTTDFNTIYLWTNSFTFNQIFEEWPFFKDIKEVYSFFKSQIENESLEITYSPASEKQVIHFTIASSLKKGFLNNYQIYFDLNKQNTKYFQLCSQFTGQAMIPLEREYARYTLSSNKRTVTAYNFSSTFPTSPEAKLTTNFKYVDDSDKKLYYFSFISHNTSKFSLGITEVDNKENNYQFSEITINEHFPKELGQDYRDKYCTVNSTNYQNFVYSMMFNITQARIYLNQNLCAKKEINIVYYDYYGKRYDMLPASPYIEAFENNTFSLVDYYLNIDL
jgi:hypothetical protein